MSSPRQGPTEMDLASLHRKAPVFAVLMVLTSLALFVPFSPYMPISGLDPSWWQGLNQAQAQQLVLGKDIVFTFGPLPALYTRLYHPATDMLVMIASIIVALSFSLTAYLCFRHQNTAVKLLILATLALWVTNHDSLLFFPALLAALYAFQDNTSPEQGKDGWKHCLTLSLCFAPLGILPLSKASALAICSASTVLSALMYLASRRYTASLTVLLTPAVLFTSLWSISGQPPSSLPEYFGSLRFIIGGFTEAMSHQGPIREPLLYLTGASIILWHVCTLPARHALHKLAFVAVVASTLFLSFKAGFVRHDGHALNAATMLLISSAFIACHAPSRTSVTLVVPACLVVAVIITSNYSDTTPGKILTRSASLYIEMFKGIHVRISDPEHLPDAYNRSLERISEHQPLPRLKGSTDIYSHDQAALIASRNIWNPRPVFQSYSAYTPELLEINRTHLLGKNPPQNIIFKTQAIDNRLTSLEDGNSWIDILNHYDPIDMIDGFLVMTRSEDSIAGKRIELSQPLIKNFKMGEHLDLSSYSNLVFIKLDIKKTIPGKILGFVYKPFQLVININLKNGRTVSRRLISDMARSHFLISPLVEDTEEFSSLFHAPSLIEDNAVKSIQILGYRNGLGWADDIVATITPARHHARANTKNFYHTTSPSSAPPKRGLKNADECHASVDYINGINPPPSSVKVGRVLKISGWMAKSVSPAKAAGKRHVVLTSKNDPTDTIYYETETTGRSDVGKHFGSAELNHSGFSVRADTHMLDGEYTIRIGYQQGDQILTCEAFSYTAIIVNDDVDMPHMQDSLPTSLRKDRAGGTDHPNTQESARASSSL